MYDIVLESWGDSYWPYNIYVHTRFNISVLNYLAAYREKTNKFFPTIDIGDRICFDCDSTWYPC